MVSFAPGETSKTITINVAGDTAFEVNESFAVNLSGATAGATISTPSVQGVIFNDDALPASGTVMSDTSADVVVNSIGNFASRWLVANAEMTFLTPATTDFAAIGPPVSTLTSLQENVAGNIATDLTGALSGSIDCSSKLAEGTAAILAAGQFQAPDPVFFATLGNADAVRAFQTTG